MRSISLLLLVLLIWVEADQTSFRLPGHAVPIFYRLDLVTFLEGNFSFHGKVWIELEAKQETDRLTLHSKDLVIKENSTALVLVNGSKEGSGEQQIAVINHEENTTYEFLTLKIDTPLQVGKRYILFIEFTGKLSDDLTGFYKISYRDNNTSEIRYVAATVFEPVHARRAFPCFDEPALKARFQINLARTENVTSLCNMPLKSSEPMKEAPGWVWDHYESSPLMSSYLAAWMIGSLEGREAIDDRGRPLRVWGRPELLDHSQYIFKLAAPLITSLENYLGVNDPLPKTDLLALPNFVTEALENWGIISFSERHLLIRPEEMTISTMISSASILAHELAHTWFGNLVTMDWWNVTWLNEGMATYFSAIAVNQVEPSYEVDLRIAAKSFLKVFARDALRSSSPLTPNLTKTSELKQVFNAITYYKGYYLLRMLNHTLGEPTFRGAMARYVSSHQYKSVKEDDLWSVLSEQASGDGIVLPKGMDIKGIMSAWSSQPGYPVVTVHRNYTDNTATVMQARFLRSKGDVETRTISNGSDQWWIPVTFVTQTEPLLENCTKPRFWLDPGEVSKQLEDLPGGESWVLFNIHAAGLYRVNYDTRNWLLLADHLDSDQYLSIPELNRALLLDDAMDLARAELLPYSIAFNVTRYLYRETHYIPWMAAFSNLEYINRMLRNTESTFAFKNFMTQLVSPQFLKLGFMAESEEKPTVKLQRRQIVQWACSVDHPGCVSGATDLFRKWRKSNGSSNPIPVEVRSIVYCTAIAHGSSEDWDFLWKRFKKSNRNLERSDMLAALGCSKDVDILSRFLSWSIKEDSGIKKQYSRAVFEAVAKNPAGYRIATNFLKDNVQSIQKYLGPSPLLLTKMLSALALSMNQPEQLNELQEFQAQHEDTLRAASGTLDQTKEMVQFNIDWLQRNYFIISDWLQERSLSL
ncbi:aminopeptidase N [Anabrus simplex]|uniref:aminopeptidase N n=1 Tax=Anabrus simplex TaxID=316456 RepID=UPI0035A37124